MHARIREQAREVIGSIPVPDFIARPDRGDRIDVSFHRVVSN
ncbi:MAG: hypothetical protein RQ936_06110 [Gammaproteobacteria bacterium]|nr:hypothetical protein [Gammaproteobacteria bacterium]